MFEVENYEHLHSKQVGNCTGWMNRWKVQVKTLALDGWKEGWVDGWMDGKAGLRIAYISQKMNRTKKNEPNCPKSERTKRKCVRISKPNTFCNRTKAKSAKI